MLEGEGEDAGVGGDDAFGVEEGFCPRTGVEEGWARGVGFGGGMEVTFREGGFGCCVEGAKMVGWHHGFGGFGIWS